MHKIKFGFEKARQGEYLGGGKLLTCIAQNVNNAFVFTAQKAYTWMCIPLHKFYEENKHISLPRLFPKKSNLHSQWIYSLKQSPSN
jgi:hypothetical protein